MLLEMDLRGASAKVHAGPPMDDEADYGQLVSAGVVPLVMPPGRIGPFRRPD